MIEQPIPDSFWKPSGDPEWTAVDWTPECVIEAAKHPEHGMPELVWEACEAIAGCQLVAPNWYAKNQIYFGFASGHSAGSKSRLGIGTGWGDDSEWRHAIYDESWRPLAVWRGARASCNGVSPRPSGAHTCIISAKLDGKAVGGLLSANEPTAKPLAAYQTSGRLNADCSDELAANFDTSGRVFIYDVKAGKETPLLVPAGEPMIPNLQGSAVYFSRWSSKDQVEGMDGWVWTAAAGAISLLAPTKKFVADLRSDGTTLAWLQLDMTSIAHAAPGELWESPAATSREALVPRLVRSVPSAQITTDYKAIGGGYYALVEQHDDKKVQRVHLYRLSDGHHWQVPMPSTLIAGAIVWLTAKEILYEGRLPSGASHTLIRQDLSTLGEGD